MKSRAIFFRGKDIRAFLAGKNMQEKRVVMPQPPEEAGRVIGPEMYEPCAIDKHGEMVPGDPVFGIYDEYGEWGVTSPYGQPGDRLWVKEALRAHDPDNDGEQWVSYDADGEYVGNGRRWWWKRDYLPCIFMPRWASRLTLEVAEVQVEWKEKRLLWVYDFKVIKE